MSSDNLYSRVLQFTWGSEMIDITNDYGYRLSYDTWQPAQSRRSKNMLGGRSPYEPTEERLPLQIRAETPEGVTRAISRLNQMLERADIFYQWEVGNPVVFHYRTADTQDKQPMSALVRRSLAPIAIPSDFITMMEGTKELYTAEVLVRFERDVFVYPSELQQTSLVTTLWQNITTLTFGDYAYHSSPAQYTLQISTSSAQSPNGYVAFQGGGSFELLTTPSSGTYVSTPETGSTSTNVFRVSATGALTWATSGSLPESGYHIFVKLRMNSGAWRIRAIKPNYPGVYNTPFITVVGTSPQVLYLGIYRVAETPISEIGLDLIRDTAGTLDIDSIMMLGIDEHTNVVGFSTTQTNTLAHISTFGADPIARLSTKIFMSDWDVGSVSGDLWLNTIGQSTKVLAYFVAGTRMNPHTGIVFLTSGHILYRWVAQPGGN